MTWWLWEVLGLALAAIELATPGGFFVIFFGISAIVIGALVLAGRVEEADALECIADRFAAAHGLQVLCAYRSTNPPDEDRSDSICRRHQTIVPAEG